MEHLTVKSSTIFISVGGKTRVYRSVDEVPSNLRKQLVETTTGLNSATILIADRRGREELVRAFQGMPSTVKSRLATAIQYAREQRDKGNKSTRPFRFWFELSLPGVVGLVFWLLFFWQH